MGSLFANSISMVFPGDAHAPPVTALQDVTLTIDPGEFAVMIGVSGCGKSTLLNMLAGFLAPTAGEIRLSGRKLSGPGADRAVVFQRHALLPWLNVIDNVAFALKLRGMGKQERYAKARKHLERLGLSGFATHPVYQLSGGMQQRVGIARALASDPELLLMDEPLGALDALTREKAQQMLLGIWRDTGKMVFFITHSVEEALFMGTKLIVMSPRPGRISHTFELDFGRRFLANPDARAVKSSPEFIKAREAILRIIFEDQAAGRDHV